jgi:hypothetical protein
MRNLLQLLLLLPFFVFSQESDTLKNKGTFSGQWRTYYMNTFNNGSLKDFAALASGGKLKYQYTFQNKFEIGAALYNSTNLGIQDLTIPDATTGRISRYEEGLFDRLDLENDAIFLLGELYLKFKLPKHEISLGRMKINSPLINPQDGRMIPTLVQGVWYKYKTEMANLFQVGVLNEIAPRSTGAFFGIGESIGTYPVGRNRAGDDGEYFGNTASDFIVLLNTDLKVSDKLEIGIWNTYVDNIANSFYLKPKLALTEKIGLELEWLHQNRLGNGGSEIEAQRYFDQNSADILGIKVDYKWQKSMVSLAYNHILPQGQFLFPREWGREDLFSFQKRERSEGTADNHALVFNYRTNLPIKKDAFNMISIFSVGRHWKPLVSDAELNKYAMPDYTHINLDLFFNFKNWKHLKPELLITSKIANGDVPNNPNFYFNKVDLFHVDFILNYNF